MNAPYSCVVGYESASDQMSRSCQANRNFSDEQIACEKVLCPTVPQIEHGTPSAEKGAFGDIVICQCDPG